MDFNRDDLKFYLEPIQQGINDINSHLKELNNKTNTNSTDIAILYDRAEQAKTLAAAAVSDAKHSGRNHGATWGGIIGGAIIAIYQFFIV